jgi:hypothetical protein
MVANVKMIIIKVNVMDVNVATKSKIIKENYEQGKKKKKKNKTIVD